MLSGQQFAFICLSIVLGALSTFLSANVSSSDIGHISINSRQFELNEPPRFKVNIVASNTAAIDKLLFTIESPGQMPITLKKQTINQYLLLLSSPLIVQSKQAQLVVQSSQGESGQEISRLSIFDAPYSIKSANMQKSELNAGSLKTTSMTTSRQARAKVQTAKQQATTQVVSRKSPTSSTPSMVNDNCIIERDNSDTLWKIANRYADGWGTNVYGAMLAIFEANMLAFSKQRIHLLLKDVPLRCPSNAILAEYHDKTADKKVFEVIEAKHASR